jgi:hypothetical protein
MGTYLVKNEKGSRRGKIVIIITNKVKDRRGGGKRCRCYERRRTTIS